jgi:hypothetical protein
LAIGTPVGRSPKRIKIETKRNGYVSEINSAPVDVRHLQVVSDRFIAELFWHNSRRWRKLANLEPGFEAPPPLCP